MSSSWSCLTCGLLASPAPEDDGAPAPYEVVDLRAPRRRAGLDDDDDGGGADVVSVTLVSTTTPAATPAAGKRGPARRARLAR